jgi:hypothetical protein
MLDWLKRTPLLEALSAAGNAFGSRNDPTTRDYLISEVRRREEELGKQDAEIAALRSNLQRAREVLEWYGDESSYYYDNYDPCSHSDVDCDGGQRARSALAEIDALTHTNLRARAE